ncbi:MAG: GGDEF domain-containing protein [Oligoflexales bacterium]
MFVRLVFSLFFLISICSKAYPFNEKIDLKKDNFTGLYDKDSLIKYLSVVKHANTPQIYPLSIIIVNSGDNIKEIGDQTLRKDQDIILRNKNKDNWTILLPNTDKNGSDVVISKLRYHSDNLQIENFRLLTSEVDLKPSDRLMLRNVELSQSHETSYSIVFIDIDKFKKINKEQGYNEGDKAIKLFAKTLKYHLRRSDFISRFGGDEFVIIFKNTGKNEVKKIMQRLQNSQLLLSFSAGIVSINRDFDPEIAFEISMKLCQTAKDQVAIEANADRMIFWNFSN